MNVTARVPTIPSEQRSQDRWAVWRTEPVPGQFVEERRLYRPFQEHLATEATPIDDRQHDRPGADLDLALAYLWTPDGFEGVAYLHDDGRVDYYSIRWEVVE
jgi:hypothetical protein